MPYDAHDARRHGLQAASYALLALRLLGRFVLYVLGVPLLGQLASLLLIWWYAYGSLLVHLGSVWEPGFPRPWTAWIAFLSALPIWAALQLLWLLFALGLQRHCAARIKAWRRQHHPEGYMMLDPRGGGEEEDERPPSSPKFPPQRARVPSLATLWYAAQVVLYLALVLTGIDAVRHYEHPNDVRLRPELQRALAADRAHHNPAGYAPQKERIFIAAAFHQNEEVLPYWTRNMKQVITYLGTDNVFVSIVENYSSDRSPDLLRAFASDLEGMGVRHRVLVQDETVKKPEHVEWNPRIEFLAAIRNQALEPLLSAAARGEPAYDRVLFSNDVYVEPESVLELLRTRDGDYDFACGLDFGHFGAYDMWVLRDRVGRLTAGIWPYFFDAASAEALKNEEPVPVYTCWNGIVAFRADPLLPVPARANHTLSHAPLARAPPASHPMKDALGRSPAETGPLRFRASAPGECYSSESFLLPYDFRVVMGLEKVFANPLVITGYVWKYYTWHKWVLRERHVKWFVERVWAGAWMQDKRMVVGDPKRVWVWEGVECHPW
ncbi:cryptococcal mannosyltransferase 1-domain-containing protein [Trametes polyzona]|nr:cryptococcal mannosyltransferase 1-domain-containing protein [Trametes polyzona]